MTFVIVTLLRRVNRLWYYI